MLLVNFPLSYICLKVGFPPESTLIVALIIAVFVCFFDFVFAQYGGTICERVFA